MKNLPPEQQEQAKGILANAQGMAGGVAQAGGGAVKGVLDTAGNTVCLLSRPLTYRCNKALVDL